MLNWSELSDVRAEKCISLCTGVRACDNTLGLGKRKKKTHQSRFIDQQVY